MLTSAVVVFQDKHGSERTVADGDGLNSAASPASCRQLAASTFDELILILQKRTLAAFKWQEHV